MTTRQQIYAEAILESRTLCARYFAGFDDSNRTRQATNLPNHFAWSLGHLGYVLQNAAKRLDGKPVSDADFILDGGHASGGGDAQRFASNSVGIGSAPVDDPTQYPTHARCVEVFSAGCQRCAAAFANASDADMMKDVPWGAVTLKAWQLAPRMIFHNGDHIGQIADLRRALGFQGVIPWKGTP